MTYIHCVLRLPLILEHTTYFQRLLLFFLNNSNIYQMCNVRNVNILCYMHLSQKKSYVRILIVLFIEYKIKYCFE